MTKLHKTSIKDDDSGLVSEPIVADPKWDEPEPPDESLLADDSDDEDEPEPEDE